MNEFKTHDTTENPPSSEVPEELHLTDERTPVAHDDQTVADDAGDYVFLKPKRSHHHTNPDEQNHYTRTVETPVRSTRSGSHHHHSRRKKKNGMKKSKKIVLTIVCVLLGLILATVGTVAILMAKGSGELYDEKLNITTPETVEASVQDDGQYIVYKGQNYKYNKNVTSLLFMGVDKREMQELETAGLGGQSDVNVLMAMDFKKGKTTMFAIPRDIVTDVAIYSVGGTYTGMEKMQLCLAYSYGDGKTKSCENQLATVRRIFYNVPISTYFALDMDGIAALNDAVGGVDVTSPETIGEFSEGGSYHLVGAQAESFVRSRSHDSYDANILRMRRQEIYAKSFMNTIVSQTKKNITTPVALFNESAPYSCTNLNPAKISAMAKELVTGKGMSFDIQIVKGTSAALDATHAQYVIDEEAFFEQFLGAYYEKVDKIEQITG